MAELTSHLDMTARTMQAIHEALNPEAMEAEGSVNQGANALGSVEALHPMVEASINMVGTCVEQLIISGATTVLPPPPAGAAHPINACTIQHVRVPDMPFGQHQSAPGAMAAHGQPHFAIAAGQLGATMLTKGAMMFDTGATISIVIDTWVQPHSLAVKPLPVTGNGVVRAAAFNVINNPWLAQWTSCCRWGRG